MFPRTNKYWVLAKVIEGRHLYGNDVRPYCKVEVLGQSESTENAFHTNNPWWNETFTIYDLKLTEEDLSKECITFQVLNPYRLKKDAVLGEFQLSLSDIYQQLSHGYVNKWLELTHSRNGMTYPSGFLKVSVLVLNNNEPGPDLDLKPNEKEEDIESNLLRGRVPIGKPARMIIHAYRAENVPKLRFGILDAFKHAISPECGDRTKIDSYLQVFFAGQTVRTKVIRNDDSPEWYEILEIDFLFPSVANKVYFTLKDWDRISRHDIVSHAILNLNETSSGDIHGFLPTFGPTWVNFTQETEGQNTSYHFRGRVLLSMKVYLHDDVKSFCPLRDKLPTQLAVCGVRKRFVLYVVLLEAILTMKITGPIKIGLSMGPYTQDKSWTDAQYPVTNDEGYAVLEFSTELDKPVLTVESEWEDYLYRYRVSLDILKVAENFENQLGILKACLKTGSSESNVLKKKITDILRESRREIKNLIRSLSEHLPDESVPETELDLKLRHARRHTLENIMESMMNFEPDLETGVLDQLEDISRKLRSISKEPQLSIPDMELTLMSKKKELSHHNISVLELLKRSEISGNLEDFRGKEILVSMMTVDDDERPFALLRLKCVFGLKSRLKTANHCFGKRGVSVSHFVETFENQVRVCGSWRPSSSIVCSWPAWSNVDGSVSQTKERFETFNDFKFVGDWFVVPNTLNSDWISMKSGSDSSDVIEDGWRYGNCLKSANRKVPSTGDTARKRCWRRQVLQDKPEVVQILPEQPQDEDEPILKKEKGLQPKTFLVYEDTYLKVTLNGYSSKTRAVLESLAPVWDQTLVNDVLVPDCKDELHSTPILIEVFDKNILGDKWLGYVILTPHVVEKQEKYLTPELKWFKLNEVSSERARILCAFEMVEVGHKSMPNMISNSDVISIPDAIRPELNIYGLEVIFWSASKLDLSRSLPMLHAPNLEFRCGKYVIVVPSDNGSDVRSTPISFAKMELPREFKYWGPITMVLKDKRFYGKHTVIGVVEVETLDQFVCMTSDTNVRSNGTYENKSREEKRKKFTKASERRVVVSREFERLDDDDMMDFDWWLRYRASQGHLEAKKRLKKLGQDTFQIYHSELEKQEQFRGFTDMIVAFNVFRGERRDGTPKICGEIKCAIKIYPLSENEEPNTYQLSKCHSYFRTISEVIVRVYVISAFDLVPKDINGKADPYIVVQLGSDRKDTRDRYLSNTLNPVFGEVFEVKGCLSEHRDLMVAIWNRDTMSPDDLLGQTVVDLESRCFTKYRATCGLPRTYRGQSGELSPWRDCLLPSEILASICELWDLPKPIYVSDKCLYIGRKKYRLKDFEKAPFGNYPKEQLSLHVLNLFPLVPEHVETRFLYDPKIPNIPRGKLRMWLDIFPVSWGPPGPEVSISPRQPDNYVLRVVIRNTYDVELQDKNALGERMSDIYVKGIFSGDIQSTDVHYRSLDGEGNFNYRFVFPFTYDVTEKMLIYRKRDRIWSLDETTRKCPPVLTLQVFDADIISRDDFLGQLELNLLRAWKPSKLAMWCDLSQVGYYPREIPIEIGLRNIWERFLKLFKFRADKKIRYQRLKNLPDKCNLFKTKYASGFWPLARKREDGEYDLTGKIEMEIQILSEEEANERPAGKGREEPNENPRLDEPKRPKTSFLWFLNPIKFIKYTLWRNHKCRVITIILVAMLILFGLIMIYNLPAIIVKRIFPD